MGKCVWKAANMCGAKGYVNGCGGPVLGLLFGQFDLKPVLGLLFGQFDLKPLLGFLVCCFATNHCTRLCTYPHPSAPATLIMSVPSPLIWRGLERCLERPQFLECSPAHTPPPPPCRQCSIFARVPHLEAPLPLRLCTWLQTHRPNVTLLAAFMG
eukprot:365955-Chlamydomonas_euryale.AAC.7